MAEPTLCALYFLTGKEKKRSAALLTLNFFVDIIYVMVNSDSEMNGGR